MIPYKIVPDSLQFSIYTKNLILRKAREVFFINTSTDPAYHYYRILDTLYILEKLEKTEDRSICIIVPEPKLRDTIKILLNKNGYNQPNIYTHLQWDAFEGAPNFKYIVAANKKTYYKRELDLLKKKAEKKLIFVNDL
jgi:hypothetical protein